MTRGLPLLLLVACAAEPADRSGRVVLVQAIDVQLSVDPEPQELDSPDPDWLQLPHCGRMGLDGDVLQVYGGLEPEITAVALIRYPGWGGLFSGGGTTELELDLTTPIEVRAALTPNRVLYELAAGVGDTGVPGAERTWSYAPNGFDTDTTAYETHQRWPIVEARVEEVEPQNCMR